MRYSVVLYTPTGVDTLPVYFKWGYQAHRYGRIDPTGFPWYTITRVRDRKVVYEGVYQDQGYWLNVTYPPIHMGGYRPMRPDIAANPPRTRGCNPPPDGPVPPPPHKKTQHLPA
jgi:hypothetical protein